MSDKLLRRVSEMIIPQNYAGQVYGEDGYLHICVTSLDNTKFYTDIIDGSIIQFDLFEFSLNYLESAKAKLIPLLASEYGIYSVGIQQKINKISISTSNRDHIDDIAAVLSEFDKNSYEIIAPSDTRPAEPPAEETTRTTPSLDPDTVTEPIVTELMKKVNNSYGDLITALSNLPSYDEKPENYAGCYTDFEDKPVLFTNPIEKCGKCAANGF